MPARLLLQIFLTVVVPVCAAGFFAVCLIALTRFRQPPLPPLNTGRARAVLTDVARAVGAAGWVVTGVIVVARRRG
jgi:hypothetical protein